VTADTSLAVPAAITLAPGDDPETAWPQIRDLGRAGGLAPLPAARLAVAVTTLVGRRHGPAVIEITQVSDARGRFVRARIQGGNASSTSAPPGLVDTSRRRISAAGSVTWVLTVKLTDDVVTGDPAASALNAAAARSLDTRELLVAVLAAVARQAGRAGALGGEVRALRHELDESNQGLLAVHAELSEQHDELERARAAAEQSTRDKADFLANMSHEIRSPMNAVLGFTGLLRATELNTEQAEYAEAAETAGNHLLGVINGILDLSKIEAGCLELEAAPYDLFACVEDAIDMLAARAAEKNLTLAALFAPSLPATVIGDSLRLRQILVNLLANAIKFTTEGQVTVEVTQPPGDGSPCELAFHVRDTGSGIPPGSVEQLFAPYTQADASTARSHGGTGLGLTICRQLARQMDGAVTVESAVGEGSTFTCTIRATAAELTPVPGPDDPRLSGTQVLVVHGQALYAEAIGRHLTDWGAELVTASSIDAAVSRSGDWPRAALAIIDASQPAALPDEIARLTGASANPALPIIRVVPMTSRDALADGAGPRLSVRLPVRRNHLRRAVLTALAAGAEPSPAAHPADVSPAGPGGAATAEAPTAAGQPTRRLLYVDDNPLLAVLVERIFAADPTVTVQTAPDGRIAFDLALQRQPDIIVIDLHLADMSGETLLRQFRADPRTRSIPAAIVSGDAEPATIQRLTDLGAIAYLTKPFTAPQLRELVRGIQHPGR
jgi:signal transduction histidine kinase